MYQRGLYIGAKFSTLIVHFKYGKQEPQSRCLSGNKTGVIFDYICENKLL